MIIPKNKIFKELKDCPGKEIKIDNITPERYFALGVCKSTVDSIKYKEIWKHISVLYIFPERRYYNVTSEETMELLIEELTRVRIPDFNTIALKYNINLTTLASIYKRKVVKATHDKIYGII